MKNKTKRFIKSLKNLGYMIKLSAKFAPLQYPLAVMDIVFDTVMPFADLLFPKWILDELTGEKRWEKILFYVIVWTAVNGVLLLLKALQWIFAGLYEQRCEVRENIHYGKIDSNMDYGRLENGAVLDEKNRIKNNIQLSYFAYNPLSSFITAIVQLVGYTYIIATLHPVVIIFLLLIIAAGSLLSKKRLKIQYAYQAKIARFQRRFNYLFGAMIGYSYAKEVRINKAAKWLAQKYGVETKEYMEVYSENQRKNFGADVLADLISFFQTIILYMYSALKLLAGSITVGSFSMYIGAISSFTNTFVSVVNQANKFKFVSDYIDSYKNYVNEGVPTHAAKGTQDIDFSTGRHEITFCNVSFKYPNTEKYVLKNVSVTIKSGQRLSVVGYNGAGKTTFIKLLCRLYEPTEGCILYNGTDISTLKYDQYVSLLSIVFQDYNIYSLSVRENICLAYNTIDEEVLRAIEQSGLSDKVKKLPRGLDTQVGKEFDPEGIEFSGGEGQKLACARAYLKNAPIVILDEPTASLDPVSESQLYERFNSIIGGKTAIYISHRLASVKFCDSVVVFVDGRIVEAGTHSELMETNGVYAQMFKKQAEYYIEADAAGKGEP
mgnify:CR=1 FL=1